jgi:predicted dehydrogenase
MKKMKVLIFGGGFGVYGHLPAYQMIPEFEVIGVVTRYQEHWRKHGLQIPVYSDIESAWRISRPDWISLAVSPLAQEEYLQNSQLKDCELVLEKPTYVTPGFSVKDPFMDDTLARSLVNFEFFEFPAWQKFLLLSQESPPDHLHIVWNFTSYSSRHKISSWKTTPRLGGGGLSHFCSHLFYAIEKICGKVVALKCNFKDETQSQESQFNVEMETLSTNVRIDFDSELPEEKPPEFSIRSSSGTSNIQMTNQRVDRIDDWVLETSNQIFKFELPPHTPAKDYRSFYLSQLIQRKLNGESYPSWSDGDRVQKIIEACRASAQQNKKIALSVT